jgi:GNAT superfamily N-acetyltransferase
MLDKRLYHHLVTWLGQWPAGQDLTVVGSERRVLPGWSGRLWPLIAIAAPGGTVLSVPPTRTATVRTFTHLPVGEFLEKAPYAVGITGPSRAYRGIFRYTLEPAPLADVGEWMPADHPDTPQWMSVFGGEVLVARDPDTGVHLAGVGVKRHDAHGHELAVTTVEAARGQGLARRLVAQAARRVLDEGAVPTYLHTPANAASARVAEEAGFPDRGWTAYALSID